MVLQTKDSVVNAHNSDVTLLNFSRKHVSPASRISGKTTAIPKRTKFPQFIRNSATNNENITFANQICTENSTTLPAVPGSVENC